MNVSQQRRLWLVIAVLVVFTLVVIYRLVSFQVVRSEQAADGGIPDQLMAISATTWHDEDGDDSIDATELQVTYRTKVAKIASYQDETP